MFAILRKARVSASNLRWRRRVCSAMSRLTTRPLAVLLNNTVQIRLDEQIGDLHARQADGTICRQTIKTHADGRTWLDLILEQLLSFILQKASHSTSQKSSMLARKSGAMSMVAASPHHVSRSRRPSTKNSSTSSSFVVASVTAYRICSARNGCEANGQSPSLMTCSRIHSLQSSTIESTPDASLCGSASASAQHVGPRGAQREARERTVTKALFITISLRSRRTTEDEHSSSHSPLY